ncbi:DUF6907 domain-containing protein [Streptomyces albidoflavus]
MTIRLADIRTLVITAADVLDRESRLGRWTEARRLELARDLTDGEHPQLEALLTATPRVERETTRGRYAGLLRQVAAQLDVRADQVVYGVAADVARVLMKAEAPVGAGPATPGPASAVVETVDCGPVRLTCPSWCTGHDEPHPPYRVDIAHSASDDVVSVPVAGGEEQLLLSVLESRPFVSDDSLRAPFRAVELAGDFHPMQPADLDRLAAAMVEGAVKVRRWARELAALQAREEAR